MVKLDEFDIVFDNVEHAYFAGQEITGRIIIKNSVAKKVNEILLEIKGCAKAYWTKHSGKSRKHCSASDAYFCERLNTLYTRKLDEGGAKPSGDASAAQTQVAEQSARNDVHDEALRRHSKTSVVKLTTATRKLTLSKKERLLSAGTHEIPFSYTLPKSLPSSFEGELGYVRYTCRAICERPWDFDIYTRRAFTVVGIEDLNENPEAVGPKSSSSTLHQKLLCFNRGEVTVDLQTSRGAYTPGETIHASARFQNKSRRAIRHTSLSLCQNVIYKAKTFAGEEQTRQTSKTVAKYERGGEIKANSESSWNDVQVIVPSVAPCLTNCKIIQINYTLQIEIQSNELIKVPIVIGTIPLLSEIVKRSTNSTQPAQPTQKETEASTSIAPDDSSVVQVTVTDESGRTATVTDDKAASPPQAPATSALSNGDAATTTTAISLHDKRQDADALNGTSKKRVRMPSSILSELYPTLPSPYYKESYFGRISISDEQERSHFGSNFFAPKYPFYADD